MATLRDSSSAPSRPVSAMTRIERYVARITLTVVLGFFAATVIASIAAEFWILSNNLNP
jgi:uncharacterized protein involved in cysteine biosynthesis